MQDTLPRREFTPQARCSCGCSGPVYEDFTAQAVGSWDRLVSCSGHSIFNRNADVNAQRDYCWCKDGSGVGPKMLHFRPCFRPFRPCSAILSVHSSQPLGNSRLSASASVLKSPSSYANTPRSLINNPLFASFPHHTLSRPGVSPIPWSSVQDNNATKHHESRL